MKPCCNQLRSSFWGHKPPTRAQTVRHHLTRHAVVHASLSGKGKQFSPDLINVKKIMGEGSYGQVFEGSLDSDQGPDRVVLKRVKKRVQGAEEMGQMEHLLNVYASKAAKGSIADFVGYIEVDDEHATTKLTQGLWLMWRYQGSRTLSYYLRRRDCNAALAEDLGVEQEAVVATVFKQVLESIAALHNAGLVHRDVKPMNIIFAEDDRRFKLIDLGACADLRSGTNYVPDESILDPTYCPPEQYCMPTDAPHLAKHGAFAMAMSPLLWQRFKPDKFDSYSAGLCLMQLALPRLRSASNLQKFNTALKAAGHDLAAWRVRAKLPAKETALLDADGAAGWDLAEALLRPRKIETDEETGIVKFVNTNGQAARLGVSQALGHRFMQQAQSKSPAMAPPRLERTSLLGRSFGRSSSVGNSGQTTEQAAAAALAATSSPASQSKGGMLNMAMGVWRKATSKLFDLEAKIANQSEAVATQTARVRQLKTEAATGKVSVAKVKQEESVLTKMTGRLMGLTSEFNATASSANRLLGSLMNRGRGTTSGAAPLQEPSAQLTPISPSPPQSNASPRRSDMPPSLQRSLNPHRRVVAEADDVLNAVEQPPQELASPSKQQAPASQPDRQAKAPPKVVRKNLTRAASSSAGSGSTAQPSASSSESSNAGVNMLYAGLKFTGLALNVAGDLAKSVRQDAERMMKEMEADAAAKRLSKEQAAAFVDMLREMQPGLTAATTLDDVESASGLDDRWLDLPEKKRQQIFGTYIEAVRKLEAAAQLRAASDFKILLAQSDISLGDDWRTVQARLAENDAFNAVESRHDRQQMFDDFIAEQQEAADQAAAIARSEEEFWGLLETQQPALTPKSSWPALRRQIQLDPRYIALPERRSRQLFNQYHSTLKDLQSIAKPAPDTLTPSQPANASQSSAAFARQDPPLSAQLPQTAANKASAAMTQLRQEAAAMGEAIAGTALQAAPQHVAADQQMDALEVLRQEQAQLKREYDRMQAKLLEMEARLQVKESGGNSNSDPASDLSRRQMSVSANGATADSNGRH